MPKRSPYEWHGGPAPEVSEGRVLSIGLNRSGPKLAAAPDGRADTTERDRLHDRSLEAGMAVDVQKIPSAEEDTQPSGRIPLL